MESVETIQEKLKQHQQQVELLKQKLKEIHKEKGASSQDKDYPEPNSYQSTSGTTNKFKTYRKRPGTTEPGKEYEQAKCGSYAFHLAINNEVEDFEMTSNNDEDGKFDDIGLKIMFKNGKSRRFVIQLKHKENRSINVADLKSESKNSDFGVKKYIDSIEKMNLGEDTVCILSTNCPTKMQGKTELSYGISFEQCDQFEFEEFLVNTKEGCQNAIFEVKLESLKQKFYFFTSQLNVKATEQEVNAPLSNLLQCDIYPGFASYMRSWWSGRFVLTKRDIIWKISELAFSPYLRDLTGNKCNEKTEYLKEAIMNFPLTIVGDCGDDIVENIWKREESCVNEDFSKTRNKYRLKEDQTSMTLWYLGKFPLVVKLDPSNERIIKCVMNFLRKDVGDKKIVLIGEVSKDDFEDWNTLKTLRDVTSSEENHHKLEIMRKFYISFQGRGCVTLENLVKSDSHVAKLIGTRELLKMTQKEHLLVGNEKEDLPELHIPRLISPNFVSTQEVLSIFRSSDDMLVIVNCDDTFANKLSQTSYVSTMDLSQYMCATTSREKSKLVLLAKKAKCTNLQFEEICKTSRKSNVYLFQYIEDEYCILLLMKGVELKTESADTTKTVKENNIFYYYDSSLQVFCAPPGMGKSTLMRVLYNSCPSDSLAVYVALINYNSFLATKPKFETILTHFLGTEAKENDLFKQLKKYFFHKRKLYMFLDGLDEVNRQHVEWILNFVKQASSQGVNIWLSSRENLREKIHQTLNVVPIGIKELSKEERQEYINNKLKKGYTSEEIEKITLAIFNSTDLNKSQNLLGIPLQLHIITEVLVNDRQIFESLEKKNLFVLTRMYKIYFEGKIKFTINKLVDQNQEQQLGYVRHILQAYEVLGLKSCLYSSDYQRLSLKASEDKDFLDELKTEGDKYGIIRTINADDEVIFNHQSYAEYFAAAWFKKNTDKLRSLKDRIFSSEYQNLRLLFDIILAENNPLHLAIIYQDIGQFENNIEYVHCRDGGGRTAFHIAFSYGQKCDIKPEYHNLNNKRDTSCYVKIIDRLFEKCTLFYQKDGLFHSDCVSYALRSNCLYPIEQILEKKLLNFEELEERLYRHFNDETIAYCSAQLGYPNLFNHCIKQTGDTSKLVIYGRLAICGCEDDDTPTTDGNIEVVRILIEKRVPLRDTLETACKFKRFNMLEILIKNGVKIDDGYENTPLHRLVGRCPEKYHQEIASAIKKFDFPVNARNRRGATALHYAAISSDSKILETLIQNGADPNILDCEGRNGLHYAARNFSPDVMKLLLDEGLNVNVRDDYGTTPLHVALEEGNTENVKLLLEKGADPKLTDNENYNGLHYASRSNEDNSDLILLLTSEGLSVNEQNQDGLTPLHLACRRNNLKNIEILLEQGADPKFVDKKGENALHHVLSAFDRIFYSSEINKIVQLLIHKGVDVNGKTHEGTTPLHAAATNKDLEVVKMLEENGADFKISDRHGQSVLHYAAKNRRGDVLKSFLSRGISVNVQDQSGVAPLHLASKALRTENIKILLEQGADPKLEDNDKNSALHYASMSSMSHFYFDMDTFRLLVSRGLDVNARNKDGLAPIHFAYMADDSETVDFLLQKGARKDVNAKFKNGQTLLHLTCKYESFKVPTELLNQGWDPNSVDNENRNALHYHLLEFYDKELVQSMINHGLNLNTQYKHGQRLLHIICLHGDYRNVRKLVEKSVDVNVLDENRQTPLQVIVKSLKTVKEFIFKHLNRRFRYDIGEHEHESETYKFEYERCYFELRRKLLERRSYTIFVEYLKHIFSEIVDSNRRIDLFLRHIKDINLEIDVRNTVACTVARFIIFEMINYLLENGAVMDNVDNFKKTAVDYASEWEEQFPEIINLLRQHHIQLDINSFVFPIHNYVAILMCVLFLI